MSNPDVGNPVTSERRIARRAVTQRLYSAFENRSPGRVRISRSKGGASSLLFFGPIALAYSRPSERASHFIDASSRHLLSKEDVSGDFSASSQSNFIHSSAHANHSAQPSREGPATLRPSSGISRMVKSARSKSSTASSIRFVSTRMAAFRTIQIGSQFSVGQTFSKPANVSKSIE